MVIQLVTIGLRRSQASSAQRLLSEYVERCGFYAEAKLMPFATETALFPELEKHTGRTRPILWLADSCGELVSSEGFAKMLGKTIDTGTQRLIFAIGPADGWSEAARTRADLLVAFGRMTLPHELAAVLAAEQLYRALTIRAGHPYHRGH